MALVGRFKVAVNNGDSSRVFELESPNQGLYVPPLVWHDVYGFAPGSVCGVIASGRYNPDDYYRVYEEFLHALRPQTF